MANGNCAVFIGVGKKLEIRSYPVLPATAGGALLKLKLSGICGTDIHIIEGRLPIPGPFIPGHEFIGEVMELGAGAAKDNLGNPIAKGDNLIACVADSCGKCFNCGHGETASCTSFGVTNIKDPANAPHFLGGFGEYLHQPVKNCVKIPAGLDLDAVAALPCAGPTSIRAFTYAGGLEKGELVVVQGTGPVGLFAIAYAAKAGCHVVAIGSGNNPTRLKLAQEFGAELVIDYRQVKPEDRLKQVKDLAAKLGRGDGADVVFEASGAPTAIPEGMNLVRTRGRYLVPGQYSASGPVAINPELITFKAIRIIGSGQYTYADIATYLDFLKKNTDTQKAFAGCISHRFKVADAEQACAEASKGSTVKAVFVS